MTQQDEGPRIPPPVATISRQLGSGGAQVGRDLAARLGVPCYDREILHLAAERLKTAADVLASLFRRRLNAHQLYFAMSEAIAHLNYLYCGGQLLRERDAGGTFRFRRP